MRKTSDLGADGGHGDQISQPIRAWARCASLERPFRWFHTTDTPGACWTFLLSCHKLGMGYQAPYCRPRCSLHLNWLVQTGSELISMPVQLHSHKSFTERIVMSSFPGPSIRKWVHWSLAKNQKKQNQLTISWSHKQDPCIVNTSSVEHGWRHNGVGWQCCILQDPSLLWF